MITGPSTPQTDSERAVTLDRVAVVPEGGIAPLALINGTSGDDIRSKRPLTTLRLAA